MAWTRLDLPEPTEPIIATSSPFLIFKFKFLSLNQSDSFSSMFQTKVAFLSWMARFEFGSFVPLGWLKVRPKKF